MNCNRQQLDWRLLLAPPLDPQFRAALGHNGARIAIGPEWDFWFPR